MRVFERMRIRANILNILLTVTALVLCSWSTVAVSQTPVPQNPPSTQPAINAGDPLAQASPSPSPNVNETRPLYGLQGVLVETLSGKVVSSQYEDQAFNPASAVKLATALAALRTLGPDHRFATGVWTDGVLDKASGTITGNLYISGRDPSFHYEHGVLLAR